MHAICPDHLIVLDLIALMKLWNYSLRNFLQAPDTESLLGANCMSFWDPKFAYRRISEVSVQIYGQAPIGDGISSHGY
jgi:hypothetical protein